MNLIPLSSTGSLPHSMTPSDALQTAQRPDPTRNSEPLRAPRAAMRRRWTGAALLTAGLLWTAGCGGPSGTEPPDPRDCLDGLANELYPCSNVNFRAFVSLEQMGESDQRANDIWGWTDPATGREYALLGLTDGVAIFDVSDASDPVYVAKLPEPERIVPRDLFAEAGGSTGADVQAGAVSGGLELGGTALNGGAGGYGLPVFDYHDDQDSSGKGAAAWRDIKTYRNTMYVVSDEQGRGMQVFDLEQLRNMDKAELPVTLVHDFHYDLFGNAHNIAINERSGFAYVIGSYRGGTCASNGGLHMIDIRDRLNPVYAGCHVETTAGGYIRAGYIHDTQCVTYDGPDADHRGKEICMSSAERRLLISDVTDKSNPVTVAVYQYPGNHYAHQAWLTEDHRTLFLNDELDELQDGHDTRTYLIDVSDLDNPRFLGYKQQDTPSIDHNLYIRGDRMYQANYMAGLRVFDVSDPTPSGVELHGFFDTTPNLTEREFQGTWSVFPWFTDGKVVLSDIEQGLFVVEVEP